jgi:hypothetical protein
MNSRRRAFLLLVALSTAAATPASGQTAAPAATPTNIGMPSAASIPDFSGIWAHPSLNALEQPLSGSGPVRNRSRLGPGPQAGVGNIAQLVGDYTNPILQPWAAEVVKKFGEISSAGKGYPTPRNQCWPEGMPFVISNFGMQMLQHLDKITILYPFDHQFRQVRMNERHPARVTPSWYGDSVGRYEGDELVIDTVGIKIGRFSMLDWFGTPYTDALHLVERYRLLDYEGTKEAIERAEKEHFQIDYPDNGPRPDLSYKGKGLQIQLTAEDEGAFTMPWSATVTFRRALDEWVELVCPENPQWHPGTYSEVPTADKPDF